jgi:hypothetical protein
VKGWVGVDWINLAHDMENAVLNLPVPLIGWEVSSCHTTGGLSSSAEVHIVRLVS